MIPLRFRYSLFLCATFAVIPIYAQVINEGVVGHAGTDNHEFLEVFGAPSTDYSNLTLVSLEGNGAENPERQL